MADKKIFLITGANAGIGFDTSYTLANASPNNHVIMTARSAERGREAVTKIQERKPAGTVSFLQIDVSSEESMRAAVPQVEEAFGRLDVLVNNAGIVIPDKLDRESILKIFDTNVFGAIILTDLLAPLLQKSNDPRIINVSSIAGSLQIRTDKTHKLNEMPSFLYRLSKASLNSVSLEQNWLYKDWDHPAKVWAFCPGYVVTNLAGDEEFRKSQGVESAETSAEGILDIVQGKRDGETLTFIGRRGETIPW
ncbi:hypothetical protein ACHAQA_007137 [Verticillium albo-atrum]